MAFRDDFLHERVRFVEAEEHTLSSLAGPKIGAVEEQHVNFAD
jgi:hypothetical protein